MNIGQEAPTHIIVSQAVRQGLDQSLYTPVNEFLGRPGKQFRSRLVELAARVSLPNEEAALWTSDRSAACVIASEVVEAIHAGALIVDDIQDRSRTRRGAPTLHLKYGVPVALNAGNWLYFWSLDRIGQLGLPPQVELSLHRECASILKRAHMGQALDVGTSIDEVPQDQVADLCLTSMSLKTGTLFELAIVLGAVGVGELTDGAKLQQLRSLGSKLGISLQEFDDIGSFAQSLGPEGLAHPKRFEDLYLRRPTGVWAYCASHFDARDYGQFVDAIRCLPNESFLQGWVEVHDFVVAARRWSKERLRSAVAEFGAAFGPTHPQCVALLEKMAAELEKSYG